MSPSTFQGEPDPAHLAALGLPEEAFSSVRLVFNENNSFLYGEVFPCDSEEECEDLTLLEDIVAEAGYGEFKFEEGVFDALALHVRRHEHGRFPIGERVDAEASLFVSADKLEATMTLEPAQGGRHMDWQGLERTLAKASIAPERCLRDAIDRALEAGQCHELVIARGSPPIPGRDSSIELLLDLSVEDKGPKLDATGAVDHYDVQDFIVVDIGTPLARKTPATRGVPGTNVEGRAIAARNGRDVPFPNERSGVVADAEDPNLLVAAVRGHPVAIAGGMRVDDVLTLAHVDLRTGNVDFEGSLIVEGDVSAGVSIRARGDIIIRGTVESAVVEAGSDLVINGGVIGPDQGTELPEWRTELRAGGNIEALFISAARVHADGDVTAREYLNHCETVALGRIELGSRGGRGLLAGGRAQGCLGVAVRRLGTSANVPTHVAAGCCPVLAEINESEQEAREALLDQIARLDRELIRLERSPGDGGGYMDKLRNTVADFRDREVEHDSRISRVASVLESAQEATIAVSGVVYPNVSVAMGSAELTVRRESRGGAFVLSNGEIRWE